MNPQTRQDEIKTTQRQQEQPTYGKKDVGDLSECEKEREKEREMILQCKPLD